LQITLCEASWTGLLDRRSLEYHRSLLALLGLGVADFPALCDAGDLFRRERPAFPPWGLPS
jgi:hypothetical protein